MEQQLQNQLTGAINAVLPKQQKPKRNSYKKASKIVEESVPKGKRTKKISQEQGFRNYLQYTDPLLLKNNELDQSDLANSFAEILNVFAPQKMGTEKIKEVEKFVALEKPVDVNDVETEIRDNAATKIKKIFKGKQTRDAYKQAIENINQSGLKKNTAVIESTGLADAPLAIGQSPMKLKKYNSKLTIKDLRQQVAKEAAMDGLERMRQRSVDTLSAAMNRKKQQDSYKSQKESASVIKGAVKAKLTSDVVKPFIEKFKSFADDAKQHPRMTLSGEMDKRYLGNNSKKDSNESNSRVSKASTVLKFKPDSKIKKQKKSKISK
jgi:hypothetical protein